MKYGVNRVTLAGNVGELPRVLEREGGGACGVDKEEDSDSRKEWQCKKCNDAPLPDICHYHVNKPINY
jgi:hypothetical protein